MANSFLKQVIEEGARNLIVKLTGVLDTSDLSVTTAIDHTLYNMSGIGPTPTGFRIDHIDFAITDQLEIQLQWHATTNVVILPLAGRGKQSYHHYGGLQNNSGVGKNGDIDIVTTGWTSGTQVFNIILDMIKILPST